MSTQSAPTEDSQQDSQWDSVWAACEAVGAQVTHAVSFADYTTSQVGAPVRGLVTATSAEQVQAVVQTHAPLFVLGGGSNIIAADESLGVTCHELLLLQQSAPAEAVSVVAEDEHTVVVRVAAGLNWDDFVAYTVQQGWGGVECLSGIPGQVGATPVQNVGAYGVEVESVLQQVQLVDRSSGAIRWEDVQDLDLAYRYSNLKFTQRAVVTAVELRLWTDGLSAPIRYRELARQLGVETQTRVPVAHARDKVLDLRRSKGMVVCGSGVKALGFGEPSPAGVWQELPDGTWVPDPDTFSTGSFFTNPVLSECMMDMVLEQVARAGIDADTMPKFPGGGGVKLSAAWLIDHAGLAKGYPGEESPARLSTRHTLALTNRGNATTADLLEVARQVRDGVQERFGVELVPEPVIVGCALPPLD